MPPTQPDGLIVGEAVQTWEPKEEEIIFRFEIKRVEGKGFAIRISTPLWAYYMSGRGGWDRPWDQLESWTTPKAKKWLGDLLEGKECGHFPGIEYTAHFGNFPKVTYRLCPKGYKAVLPVTSH
jgi:hypothetical protein